MKVLVSTLTASGSAAHGGPIIANRQAQALARAGCEVLLVAPSAAQQEGTVPVRGYEAEAPVSRAFAPWRPNPAAAGALGRILGQFRPDVVYDVHGPAWAIEAAGRAGIPSVSMVGDYNWFCRRSFLLDTSLERCSGPDSIDKCFKCCNRDSRNHRYVAQIALKHAAQAGVVGWLPPFPQYRKYGLWEALVESDAYVEDLRATVARFVVGDEKAHAFFLSHGVPRRKIVRLAQGLPDEALVSRRELDGSPVLDRPLRLAFVGRSDPDKGFHVLARAFEECGNDSRLELWIVHRDWATPEGACGFFSSQEWFGAQLAAGRIKLHRPQEPKDVYGLMAKADVGVVPSLAFESPSLVMLEFVAQATPVVRSESAGMNHVICDGLNGRTFPYGDAARLGAILREIAGAPSVLEEWRAALPRIGSDRDYARRLVAILESTRAPARNKTKGEEECPA